MHRTVRYSVAGLSWCHAAISVAHPPDSSTPPLLRSFRHAATWACTSFYLIRSASRSRKCSALGGGGCSPTSDRPFPSWLARTAGQHTGFYHHLCRFVYHYRPWRFKYSASLHRVLLEHAYRIDRFSAVALLQHARHHRPAPMIFLFFFQHPFFLHVHGKSFLSTQVVLHQIRFRLVWFRPVHQALFCQGETGSTN